jgi:hypothetical protein
VTGAQASHRAALEGAARILRSARKIHLPPRLNEIAGLIGKEAALRLAEIKGGTRVYIPRVVAGRSAWIVNEFGIEAARKLAKRFGGCRLDIPFGPHAEIMSIAPRVKALQGMGLSTSQIARALKITERTVIRHKEKPAKRPAK